MDDQLVKGRFQTQLERILFGGLSDVRFKELLQMKRGIMHDAAQRLYGQVLIQVGEDVVDDPVDSLPSFGLGDCCCHRYDAFER